MPSDLTSTNSREVRSDLELLSRMYVSIKVSDTDDIITSISEELFNDVLSPLFNGLSANTKSALELDFFESGNDNTLDVRTLFCNRPPELARKNIEYIAKTLANQNQSLPSAGEFLKLLINPDSGSSESDVFYKYVNDLPLR